MCGDFGKTFTGFDFDAITAREDVDVVVNDDDDDGGDHDDDAG